MEYIKSESVKKYLIDNLSPYRYFGVDRSTCREYIRSESVKKYLIDNLSPYRYFGAIVTGDFMSTRDVEYKLMYEAYLQYEAEYWKWAMLRKQFAQDVKNRKYYRKNGSKTRRKYAEKVVFDYSELALSGWDIKEQVGGCKEIIFEYGLGKWKNDSYILSSIPYGRYVYEKLRNNPDLIYDAIEDTYNWSIKLGIKTTVLAEIIPKIIDFIATECIKEG